MMRPVFVVDIEGEVDQSGLERLRSSLNLTKQGRLTDDWDQTFGHRIVDSAQGQRIRIGLFREFDGSWFVQITARPTPVSDDEIIALRTELEIAITAAGFVVGNSGLP